MLAVHGAERAGVDAGRITRGITNVKPRFGKSCLFALWCAWWLLKRPFCRFLYLSCSDVLAREQSDLVRSVVLLPECRLLWGVELKEDSHAKGLWKSKEGGAFRAVSSGGQVVGFGAGILGFPGFAGAVIDDDPLKPEDIRSIIAMETMNGRYMRTVRHRVNDPSTPILIVMQRLHDLDLSGFLLNGGSGETWDHLRIPAVVVPEEEARAAERYNVDWRHGRRFPVELNEGYVWPSKFSEGDDAAERLDVTTWAAQSLQSPRVSGGSMLRVSWFRRFERFDVDSKRVGHVWREGEEVELRYLMVTADTAAKTGERNDYSVFELWGVGRDKHLYLLDLLRGKWEAPELLLESSTFLARYGNKPPRRYGWREVHIEDKSSGIGLIQQLRRAWGGQVHPVERSIDKVSRALSVQLPLSQGLVYIPSDAPWLPEFLAEVAAFSRDGTHAHDDQVDAMFDAINLVEATGGSTVYDVVGGSTS